ncbi:MAG: hypothetical protein HQ527_08180 [Cyanobacteria bacterium]|nr:hypothetical protein [Cyanobacteria bacterium bin.51]
MSPLFPCSGCGVQIERSVRLYLQQKGLVLCSTCKDRQDAEAVSAPQGDPGEAAPGPD